MHRFDLWYKDKSLVASCGVVFPRVVVKARRLDRLLQKVHLWRKKVDRRKVFRPRVLTKAKISRRTSQIDRWGIGLASVSWLCGYQRKNFTERGLRCRCVNATRLRQRSTGRDERVQVACDPSKKKKRASPEDASERRYCRNFYDDRTFSSSPTIQLTENVKLREEGCS